VDSGKCRDSGGSDCNVGIAVAAIAASTIASGARPWMGRSTAVRPNITHHARLATVATEGEQDQLAPGRAQEELKALYPEWKRFCEASVEPVSSEKTFSQKLERKNLIKTKGSRSRRVCFRGLRLRPNYDEPEAWVSSPDAAALRGSRDA
jgi:hypothetical protein